MRAVPLRSIASVFAAAMLVACTSETDPPASAPKAPPSADGNSQPIAVECKTDDAIAAEQREELESRAKELHTALRTGELEKLWDDLHPQARRDDQRELFMEALAGMEQRLQITPMLVNVERVHHVDLKGGSSDLAQVKCGEGDSRYTLLVNAGDEDVGVVILRSPAPHTEHVTTVQLRRRGDRWRLLGIQVNPSRYRGKNAAAFEELGDGFMRTQKVVMGYFMLGLAQILSGRGAAVESIHHQRIEDKIAAITRDQLFKAEMGTWALGDDRFTIEGLSLIATRQEISPVIKYVSPQGLVKDLLDRDADKLIEEVRRRFPELSEHFDTVVFEAYAKTPEEAGENRQAYRLVRFLDPDKRREQE